MTRQTTDALLTLNAGSSSLKFRLFGMTPDLPFLLGGKVGDIGGKPSFQVHWQENSHDEIHALSPYADAGDALAYILNWLAYNAAQWPIHAAVHRIVHGGPVFDRAVELDAKTVEDLRELIPLAPMHQPHNLAPIEALWERHPNLRQFGCFDTAFHAHHGSLATTFALPAYIREQGVRRYGFHGLSYSWIVDRLKCDHPHLAKGRVVAAHLGNGASLCALKDGKSIDTTMGLTALDGLPMGTRCGALDPGAILYMQKVLSYSADEVERILYDESGLKGLSGISNDVKVLLDCRNPNAVFALEYFAFKTAQQIAALAVSIGGLDGLVFTGGIGENAEPVRHRILEQLEFLGPFEVHILPTNEERAMASEVFGTFLHDAAAEAS